MCKWNEFDKCANYDEYRGQSPRNCDLFKPLYGERILWYCILPDVRKKVGVRMSNIHKFKVEPIEGHQACAKVTVDGEQWLCSSYKIEHYAGSLPMDKKTFKKFCRVWEDIHDEA